LTQVVRILGIDPGFRLTGYGLIDTNGQESCYVAHGSIKNTSADPAARLKNIFSEVRQVIATYQPDELAIEKVFVAKNADSALKLGQARSAAICASFDTEISVHEYAPRLMKKSITGRGSADKEQVQHMVRVLLSYSDPLTLDESDALGLALCHAHTRAINSLLSSAVGGTA
jgi:crossover junction endodeoxyribonuclease RuvC